MKGDLRLEKSALRREMRLRLSHQSHNRDQHSRLLCEALKSLPACMEAHTLGLFFPLPEEPNLLEMLDLKAKRFVFPCIEDENLVWRPAKSVCDFHAHKQIAGRSLLAPREGEEVPLSHIECLIVPGLAFTEQGDRLGRGGGYYDRVLSNLSPGTRTVGVCFSFQLVQALPREAHDLPVQNVVHA